MTMLKVLYDRFDIERGFMTTIHAYTNAQVLLDVNDTDLRRACAAALNTIPTSTSAGAAAMLGKIVPNLEVTDVSNGNLCTTWKNFIN